MPHKYPPLTPAEVIAILDSRGFSLAREESSHRQYRGFTKGQERIVTVDTKIKAFEDKLIKSTIHQSGLSREEFYGSTKEGSGRLASHRRALCMPIASGQGTLPWTPSRGIEFHEPAPIQDRFAFPADVV